MVQELLRMPTEVECVPTPVEVQGMTDGVEWRKRVSVSYAEAFKEELLHFHECVHHDRDPLTDGCDEGMRRIAS